MDYKQEIEPGMDVNVIKHDCCECEGCQCGCQEGKECTCGETHELGSRENPINYDVHRDEEGNVEVKGPDYIRTDEGILPVESGTGEPNILKLIEVGDVVNYADVVAVRDTENGREIDVDYFGNKDTITEEAGIFSCLTKEVNQQWKDKINEAMGKYPDYPTPGVLFEDINPILRDSNLLGILMEMIALNTNNLEVDYLVCPESRGFIFGSMLAIILKKPILLARKPGKLPGKKHTVTFKTEYSEDTLEMQAVDLTGKKVWFIDDVYATGGTYFACKELVEKCNGTLVGGTVVKSVLDKHPEEVRPVL